jgi:HEAT repeat protein
MIGEKELLEELGSIGIKATSVRELATGLPNYEKGESILRKHRKKSKDAEFRKAVECAIMNLQKDLIDDLKHTDINVSSVWDLVNGQNNYAEAESILIKHLKKTEECRFKEGIVRALGVKGFKNAVQPLIDEFKKGKDSSYKWAVANSLSIIAPKEAAAELMEIMGDQRHGDARQMIADALGTIGDRSAVAVLVEALKDKNVAGHAVDALGRIGDESAIEPIKPFLDHKMRWVRKAAEKALERIAKKSARRRKKAK